MNVRYQVELNQAERSELVALLSGGKHAARKLKRAQILLTADAGASDENIAASAGGRRPAVQARVCIDKRQILPLLWREGFCRATQPRPGAARKLLGKEEALLVATACSNPPEGRTRWTLDLLAGAMVKLTEHDSISRETVRQRLACMRELTDVHFPAAERIRVVLDNLSTHSAGALYQAIPASEARRVLRRLEFHYVPNDDADDEVAAHHEAIPSRFRGGSVRCAPRLALGFAAQSSLRRLGKLGLRREPPSPKTGRDAVAPLCANVRFSFQTAGDCV